MSYHLVSVTNEVVSGRLVFNLSIGGTKVAQAKQISQKYKAIIGVSHSNNLIILNGISYEEVKEKLLKTSYSFQFYTEFKVVVIP